MDELRTQQKERGEFVDRPEGEGPIGTTGERKDAFSAEETLWIADGMKGGLEKKSTALRNCRCQKMCSSNSDIKGKIVKFKTYTK